MERDPDYQSKIDAQDDITCIDATRRDRCTDREQKNSIDD